MSSGKRSPTPGKLVTGNDGNFMLLLDPLSEDQAVFTSVRYTSDSELSATTGSGDSSMIVDTTNDQNARTTEQDDLNVRKQGTSNSAKFVARQPTTFLKTQPATFLPNQQCNTETGFKLLPMTGSVNNNLIYTPSVSSRSTSTATTFPAVSRQSKDVSAIPSNGHSSKVQSTCSNLTPNMCFINSDQKLLFPTVTPLIIIPASQANHLPSSSAPSVPTTSVMQANKSVTSSQPQCFLTASTMLQSIAMTGNCVPPSFTKQPNKLNNSSDKTSASGKNESSEQKNKHNHTSVQATNKSEQERNIQIVYPSTLTKRGQSSKFFIPLTGPQTSVTITGPSAVSSSIVSPDAPATTNLTNKMMKCIPVTVPSQPQMKMFSNVVDISGSNSISSVVSSRVPPPRGNSIIISPSSKDANTQQAALNCKRLNVKKPVIVRLPFSDSSSLPEKAIGDITVKSKSHAGHYMSDISEKVNTIQGKETVVVNSQGKETLVAKSQGNKTVVVQSHGKEIPTVSSGYVIHKQQTNNSLITGNQPLITSPVQTQALPFKIHNVFSLASDVSNVTTCQDKARDSERLITNQKNTIEVVCRTKLTDFIYSCYPVLEKLSDRQIAHIMSSIAEEKRGKCRRKLRSRNRRSDSDITLERKCSSYCRKRTLNFLCRLGMLNCKKIKCCDPSKTKPTPDDAKKQPEDKRLRSVSTSDNDKSNLLNSVAVQNTSAKSTSSDKSRVKVSNVVQPGLKTKVIPVDSKSVPMQLVMMNNKLFLVPMTGNTVMLPRVLSTSPVMPTPVLTNTPTSVLSGELRSKLAAGVQQRMSNGGAQSNIPFFLNQPVTWNPNILKKNGSVSIPTFRPTFTPVRPLSKPSNPSGVTVCLPQSSFKGGAPNSSQASIIVQTPKGQHHTIFMKDTVTLSQISKTSALTNVGAIQKDTKTTEKTPVSCNAGDIQKDKTSGKKVEPWKLPWNYEIKSEPVTEGYGDEEPYQKSAEENQKKPDHVMTIRLPLQKPRTAEPSAPITWIPRDDPSVNTSNNANTFPPYHSETQKYHQSKISKTGTELLVESSQSSRIQRLKEILREKEQMLEDLKRKHASSVH